MAASPRRSASVAPGMAIHIPPSFGNPGVSISYRPKALVEGKTCFSSPLLSVAVPPASIHHIFNHRQWRAGMLMSDALVSGAFDVTNRNVLELGSGTGLPSITAAQLDKAKLVVSSDYDEPAIVAELKSNIKSNSAGKRIKVAGHIWGKNIQELLDCLPTSRGQQQPKFDLILMADCLWDPLSHSDLLKTLTLTLAKTPEARVHVIAGLHTGREKITGFVRRAYRAGLTLAPIANASCWPSLPVDKTTSEGHINVSDEPLRHASERILELQVSGNKPTASTVEDAEASADVEVAEHADEPRLTGDRRVFLIEGYGEEEEGHVRKRNKWLTVWSLMWIPS